MTQYHQGYPQGYPQQAPQPGGHAPQGYAPQGYAQPQQGYAPQGYAQPQQGQQQEEAKKPTVSMTIPGMRRDQLPVDVPEHLSQMYGKECSKDWVIGKWPAFVTWSDIRPDEKVMDEHGRPTPRLLLSLGVHTSAGPRSYFLGVNPTQRPAWYYRVVESLIPTYNGEEVKGWMFKARTCLISVEPGTGDYAERIDIRGIEPLPVEQTPWAGQLQSRGAQRQAAPQQPAGRTYGQQPPQQQAPQGYPPQGYAPQQQPPQQQAPQGYPPMMGFPAQAPQGYPPQGYAPQQPQGAPAPQGAAPFTGQF